MKAKRFPRSYPASGAQCLLALLVLAACFACKPGDPSTSFDDDTGFVLHGRLLDPAGAPIAAARVATARKSLGEAVSVAEVDADGSYRLKFAEQGYLEVRFQAVDREDRIARFWVGPEDRMELRLDACLSPFPATEDVKAASVVGDFNDFDRTTGVPFEEQEDGSWLASIETSQSEIEYQVNGLHKFGASYHGSDPESLRYRSDRSWVGVAEVVNGKAEVRLEVPAHADSPLVSEIFERLNPASPVLPIPGALHYKLAYDGIDQWGERATEFIERVLAEHPDADFKASLLGALVTTAVHAGDQETADERMQQLVAAYPESEALEFVRELDGKVT